MGERLIDDDHTLWRSCDCTREEAGGLALFSSRYRREKLLADPLLFVLDRFELQYMSITLWSHHYMAASQALAAYHCLSSYRLGLRDETGFFNRLRSQVSGD